MTRIQAIHNEANPDLPRQGGHVGEESMNETSAWSRVVERVRAGLVSPRELEEFEQMLVHQAHAVAIGSDHLTIRLANRHYLAFAEDNFRDRLDDGTHDVLGDGVDLRLVLDGGRPATVPPTAAPAHAEAPGRMRLDARMTFDSFVVGACNRIANAAARAVVDDPGGRWNPLYIYGASGLGKTHLLNAIGHEIQRRDPSARVVYVTADDFIHEFVQAIRRDNTRAFRMHYREEASVLLMDDIQFLDSDRSQEELFYIFNVMQRQRRQMVFTSDVEPQEIEKFEPRLRTRFQGGQIVDMQAPDRETATAILLERARAMGRIIPDDLAATMAHAVTGNVRELLGLLNRLVLHCDTTGEQPSLSFAREVMPEVFAPPAPRVDASDVIAAVARVHNLRTVDIIGKSRTRQLTEPRHIAMFLARKHTTLSFPQLGEEFGGRDHSTIQHGVRKIQERIDGGDPELAYQMQIIERQLGLGRGR